MSATRRASSSTSSTEARRRRALRRILPLLVALCGLFRQGDAFAATRVHALVIGNNAGFVAGVNSGNQPSLRYADDDAAAFTELIAEVAPSPELLTVMDRETQALFPKLAGSTRPPTLAQVRHSVKRIAQRIGAQQAAGHRNVVLVFFSGHGAVDYQGKPALSLSDGGLDQDFLYREIIEALPADEIHLLIDACHAEAIVRPRDQEAEAVRVSSAQVSAFLRQNTLARYPHVGAIVAASTSTKAHEWDALRHGIFTHELLSALRGAADVNRDRRLEYSEVYAFMAAANREVGDERARPAIVARPPDANRRAALVTLSEFRLTNLAWLSRVPGGRGIVRIDDASGRRLATLHGDADSLSDLLIPAGTTLFVHDGSREASFHAGAGEVVAFAKLSFAVEGLRERGGLEEALRRGLFAAEYGKRYYQGVVDQTPGFLPVDFGDARGWALPRTGGDDGRSGSALVVGGGLSTGVADVVQATHGATLGWEPLGKSGVSLALAAVVDDEGPLTEWRAKASAGWLWSFGHASVRAHAGARVGGGLIGQVLDGEAQQLTGFVDLGPVLGLTTNVTGRFGLWSELELPAAVYRRDDRLTLSFMPSAWLGGSLRL